jgi:hypothetical protein
MAAKVVKFGPDGPDQEKMRALLGPGHVSQIVHQAIQSCWMMLPQDRRTIDHLETEVRRLVDRAFRDMREDHASFRGKK